VLGYVRKRELMRAGDRVGVAVSGGADSVALLQLMLELRNELGIVLSVVHLNHKLRGAESDIDAEFVRGLAERHALEFTSESRDVKMHAAERKLSLEAAAREVRYEFFRCVLQSGVDRIATAHTLDDQAETVLLKLTRGAGTRGLAGIYPKIVAGKEAISTQQSAIRMTALSSQLSAVNKSEINSNPSIIRPLLGIRRSHLREYLAGLGQTWREDATNQDLKHTRNRIRLKTLPQLEREVNPSIWTVLAETAEIAREEEEYWSAEVARVLPELWMSCESGGVLKGGLLHDHPIALQRRIVRAAAQSMALSLEFDHVEEVLTLSAEGDCATLPENWKVTRRGHELRFEKTSFERADYEYVLRVPGRVRISQAEIEIEALLVTEIDKAHKYNPEHVVDRRLARGLVVRNWRPGERFWPTHSKGPKKIKELLQDRHITGEEKRLWPVVVSGGEIVWIRGLGVRRDFQASGSEGILIREVDQGGGGSK